MYSFDHVRIPPDRQIGRHSQSGYELDYVVSGRGIRTLGSVSEPFREGEVVLVPPELPHRWTFDPQAVDRDGCIENISFHFSSTFPEKLAELFPELSAGMLRLQNLTEAVLYRGEARERLVRSLTRLDSCAPEARSAETVLLMTEIANLGESVSVSSISKLSSAEKRLEKIRVYVRCNYARPMTVGEVASYVGMNRTAFCSFYKKAKGRTFIADLNIFRLETAAGLLTGHPEMPVSDVAAASGFGTLSHFVRSFTRWKGLSPGKWRREKLGQPAE